MEWWIPFAVFAAALLASMIAPMPLPGPRRRAAGMDERELRPHLRPAPRRAPRIKSFDDDLAEEAPRRRAPPPDRPIRPPAREIREPVDAAEPRDRRGSWDIRDVRNPRDRDRLDERPPVAARPRASVERPPPPPPVRPRPEPPPRPSVAEREPPPRKPERAAPVRRERERPPARGRNERFAEPEPVAAPEREPVRAPSLARVAAASMRLVAPPPLPLRPPARASNGRTPVLDRPGVDAPSYFRDPLSLEDWPQAKAVEETVRAFLDRWGGSGTGTTTFRKVEVVPGSNERAFAYLLAVEPERRGSETTLLARVCVPGENAQRPSRFWATKYFDHIGARFREDVAKTPQHGRGIILVRDVPPDEAGRGAVALDYEVTLKGDPYDDIRSDDVAQYKNLLNIMRMFA